MKVGRRKTWLGIIGFVLLYMTGCSTSSEAGDKPEEIRLDYAYYSPTSLVLKEFGWLEEAFADEDIEIEWALSQGSNKALRSEEHTSELQSRGHLVCRLLLEKKKAGPFVAVI